MKASEFKKIIREEVRKALRESVMSDIDIMAKQAISFNAFAVTFFKEYGSDLEKEDKLAAIKWLKTVYMNARKNK